MTVAESPSVLTGAGAGCGLGSDLSDGVDE